MSDPIAIGECVTGDMVGVDGRLHEGLTLPFDIGIAFDIFRRTGLNKKTLEVHG